LAGRGTVHYNLLSECYYRGLLFITELAVRQGTVAGDRDFDLLT